MGKPGKKQGKRGGVDFKKIKRKIGRKLPPPKNATDTRITSKAIVIKEQSVAADRDGETVSLGGMTLQELLTQSSHTSVKSRRVALIGIKQLLKIKPEEGKPSALELHRLAIIEKLRERICDEDKIVRDTLYELLKTVIFPGSKEENHGAFTSLIMAYIFNAMTHLSIDIRLMAFEFYDLVVQNYPASFLSHAEKVLQNYGDILRKNHVYLGDKSQLKSGLLGLVHCLSLLPHEKKELHSTFEKDTDVRRSLHAFEPEVSKDQTGFPSTVKKVEDLMPILFNCFQELAPSICLEAQSLECMNAVLQSIDLAVRFFVYGMDRSQLSFDVLGPMHKEPDVTVWGETVMPILLKKLVEVFPVGLVNNHTEKVDDRSNVLNISIVMIFLHFGEWIYTPALLMDKFMQFIESLLTGQIFCTKRSSKALREKHLVSILPFFPRLLSQVSSSWKSCLLQAFTNAFKRCKPESSLSLAFLSAIEEMLLPSRRLGTFFVNASDPELKDHQTAWIQGLPSFLIGLGDRYPSSSKIVLRLLLRLGQCAPMNSCFAFEYDSLQHSLREFYCIFLDGGEGGVQYGPFTKLPKDCQEFAVSCLYYFSRLESLFLKTLAQCCLCKDLEEFTLFRIIEVLQAAYKSGHIQIADHISFFLTILSRFKESPEGLNLGMENEAKIPTHRTFKAITSAICSCVSQMGDNALIHQMIQKTLLLEMSLKPSVESTCAMLRMLVVLDSRQTQLSDENIISLGNSLWSYLMDATYYVPELGDKSTKCIEEIYTYFCVPCLILFNRSDSLLTIVLNLMGSSIVQTNSDVPSPGSDSSWSRRIVAIAFTLVFMYKEVKIHHMLSSHKSEIRQILQSIFFLQSSNEIRLSLEERRKIQSAFNYLKTITGRIHCWSSDDFKSV